MSEERVALIGRRGTKGFTPVPTSFHLLNFSACVPSVCVCVCSIVSKGDSTPHNKEETRVSTHTESQMQGDNIPFCKR